MSEASEVRPPAPEAGPPTVTPVRVVIALCLLAPFAAMLWVGSYAKTDPAFIGIPFFYWYQMAWVLISTALTATAYVLWQRDQRARTSRGSQQPQQSEQSQDGGVEK
ncbi:DUF3311 domain-containing protein [Streptomyces akebiae]|uniref:DUF3311 domain-containing protein n=1 Tax=Streptomyces akebiae TaxID=2865673 RepID=A0ABX8XP92_9ACTN|nr:DUF3311 domain-containing protein [Streptomyces akebiae]QYX77604.1 DUF3311 domain-containing protein [Streptomyces akebiae]